MEAIEQKLIELARQFESYAKDAEIDYITRIRIDDKETAVQINVVYGDSFTITFGFYPLEIQFALYSNRITKPFDITDQQMTDLYDEVKAVLDRLLNDADVNSAVKVEARQRRIAELENELQTLKNK